MKRSQPNYIEYLNNFWQVNDEKVLLSTQVHCYFTLLSIFNRRKWPQEISLSDALLAEIMGVARNTVRSAKVALMQRGLIVFKNEKSPNCAKTSYQLCDLSSVQDPVQNPSQDPAQKLNTTPIYSKQNNNYTNTNTKNNFNYERSKGFNISKGDFN